jgi:hypothetical protein
LVIVNVDKPLKTFTAHTSPECPFVQRYMKETPNKGVGSIKRDGGWFHFDSVSEMKASSEVSSYREEYEWIVCSKC